MYAILLAASLAIPAAAPVEVTFNKDVAPILWKNCTGCHRAGEVGPFPLLNYADAAKRADHLVDVTQSRQMPPWKATAGYGQFHGERRLSEKELNTLAAWAKAGAPRGRTEDLPAPPSFPEGWQLGKPDLVLKMAEAFTVPASGRDVFQCFVLPTGLSEDRTVSAVEFRPGNRKVVHHCIMYLDNTGSARRKDAASPGPGYSSFGGPGIIPTGGLGGWAPGTAAIPLPEGVGRFLRRNSDVVLQMHYHPSGKQETDQSSIGVYFTKSPAKRILGGVAVRSRRLDIPPGDADHRIAAESAPLPVPVEVVAIFPHMHYIGKQMKVFAVLPSGGTVPLIWIKDWDFNWQGAYQYEKPVSLPKGAVVKVEAVYDNSAENPKNPSSPPRRVRWGEQTTDEMCLLGLQAVTQNVADLRQLSTMRGNGLALLLGGGAGNIPTSTTEKAKIPSGGDGREIPPRLRPLLNRFDANGDGKLSNNEIDAIPEAFRDRVKRALENSRN